VETDGEIMRAGDCRYLEALPGIVQNLPENLKQSLDIWGHYATARSTIWEPGFLLTGLVTTWGLEVEVRASIASNGIE